MLKIIICDDEKNAVDKIEQLSKTYFQKNNIEIEVKTFTRSKELLELKFDDIDILFLDVEMDEINGIDVAKRIRETNKKLNIIYISSYIDYAMAGYEVRAFNYLIKSDLSKTFTKCLDKLMEDIYMQSQALDITIQNTQYKVLLSEIAYIESNKRVLNLYLNSNNEYKIQYTFYGTMRDIDNKLSSKGFLRIQNSYLVNMNYIKSIKSYYVELKNGQKIKASIKSYAQVLEKWTLWLGDL